MTLSSVLAFQRTTTNDLAQALIRRRQQLVLVVACALAVTLSLFHLTKQENTKQDCYPCSNKMHKSTSPHNQDPRC